MEVNLFFHRLIVGEDLLMLSVIFFCPDSGASACLIMLWLVAIMVTSFTWKIPYSSDTQISPKNIFTVDISHEVYYTKGINQDQQFLVS